MSISLYGKDKKSVCGNKNGNGSVLKVSQSCWNIMSSAIKKNCRLALKLMKPFSFHCYYFFLSRFSLVLLFTISWIFAIFFCYCCLAYIYVDSTKHHFHRAILIFGLEYIYPANQPNRAVSIWNYVFFFLAALNYLEL